MKDWFEKLAQEEPALYREPAPDVHIQMFGHCATIPKEPLNGTQEGYLRGPVMKIGPLGFLNDPFA